VVATVALSAAAVVVVGLLVWAFLRHDRADETERFHRAREITTSWAAPGPQIHDSVHVDDAARTTARPTGPVPPAAPAQPVAAEAAADDATTDDEPAVQVRRGAVKRDTVKRDTVKRGAARDAAAGDATDRG
jgi:hypothetical protein